MCVGVCVDSTWRVCDHIFFYLLFHNNKKGIGMIKILVARGMVCANGRLLLVGRLKFLQRESSRESERDQK